MFLAIEQFLTSFHTPLPSRTSFTGETSASRGSGQHCSRDEIYLAVLLVWSRIHITKAHGVAVSFPCSHIERCPAVEEAISHRRAHRVVGGLRVSCISDVSSGYRTASAAEPSSRFTIPLDHPRSVCFDILTSSTTESQALLSARKAAGMGWRLKPAELATCMIRNQPQEEGQITTSFPSGRQKRKVHGQDLSGFRNGAVTGAEEGATSSPERINIMDR